MSQPEQADGHSKRASSHHQFIKKRHVRLERRKAKKDPEVQPTYRKYQGWES
jgi:hypothetical protein